VDYYCRPEAMAIIYEIANRRIPRVLGKAQELNGGERPRISERRIKSLTRVRRLHFRFLSGKYTITSKEWGNVKDVGDYLLNLHCQNEGHPPKSFDWSKVGDFWTRTPPPPGAYDQIMNMIASGALDG